MAAGRNVLKDRKHTKRGGKEGREREIKAYAWCLKKSEGVSDLLAIDKVICEL